MLGNTRIYYGEQHYYDDITDILSKYYTDNNIITIHPNDYINIFGACSPITKRHIKITIPDHPVGTVYIKSGANFTLNLNHLNTTPPIHIVYFINTYISPHYEHLLRIHLTELLATGLCEHATLYVEACGSDFNKIEEFVLSIIPSAQVTCHPENNHEYFGILKVWEIAQQEDGLVLYFHSKGISRLHLMPRDPYEAVFLSPFVIQQWRRNIALLSIFDSINKLGIANGFGWIWLNYMWGKCSYLREVERPIITDDRYYYEVWISRRLPKYPSLQVSSPEQCAKPNDHYYSMLDNDCFSIAYSLEHELYNVGSPVTPPELAGALLPFNV